MAGIRFCEVCKQQIDPERAQANPMTRLCGVHAEEINDFGGEFILSGKQERTNKSGSLKINYGGIAVSQERNLDGIQRLKDRYEEQQG